MKITLKRLQDNFGRAAAQYDAHADLQRREVERVLRAAVAHLPAKARIADIGCGTGYFAERARPAFADWRIVGIDIAEGMVRAAAPRCHHVLQGDAMALPLADNSMDAVVSSLCLQWVGDKPAMLNEIRRVLKPGGTAIITTLGDATLHELRETFAEQEVTLGLLPMIPAQEYKEMVTRGGFRLADWRGEQAVRYYHSARDLLDSMRRIGAGNAGERHPAPPKRFARAMHTYDERHRSEQGVSATWEPILIVAVRP